MNDFIFGNTFYFFVCYFLICSQISVINTERIFVEFIPLLPGEKVMVFVIIYVQTITNF